ncbi:MAG: ParA family protein [Blastocatellia bacterium]|nr:ParA family protein [Blastocatellia bacterium]
MGAKHVIVVCNQKGGVGKTITAVTVAAELAILGHATLLIDADPQSNATACFFNAAEKPINLGLAHSLLSAQDSATGRLVPPRPLEDCRLTTEIVNLDLVPSTIGLALFDKEDGIRAIMMLRAALRSMKSEYEFVIIDTPPNLALLLSTTLVAATHILIPVDMGPFALDGLDDLMGSIFEAAQLNSGLKILGIVPTRYDKRTRISADCMERLRFVIEKSKNCRKLGVATEAITSTVINLATKLNETGDKRQPIQLFAPESRSAEEYAALTEELLQRLRFPPRQIALVTGTLNA